MDIKTVLLGAAVGSGIKFLDLAVQDLESWYVVWKEDRTVKFDWRLAFLRWVKGAIQGTGWGTLGGIGVGLAG